MRRPRFVWVSPRTVERLIAMVELGRAEIVRAGKPIPSDIEELASDLKAEGFRNAVPLLLAVREDEGTLLGGVVPLGEVARLLDVTKRSVENYLNGGLASIKVGGRRYVSLEALERFIHGEARGDGESDARRSGPHNG